MGIFLLALVVNALLVSTALAAPPSRPDRIAKRLERRARLGRPMQAAGDAIERRGNLTSSALTSELAGVILDSTLTVCIDTFPCTQRVTRY